MQGLRHHLDPASLHQRWLHRHIHKGRRIRRLKTCSSVQKLTGGWAHHGDVDDIVLMCDDEAPQGPSAADQGCQAEKATMAQTTTAALRQKACAAQTRCWRALQLKGRLHPCCQHQCRERCPQQRRPQLPWQNLVWRVG